MAIKHARIQHMKDTTANWLKANPTLLDGEIGFEVQKSGEIRVKVGDGITPWNKLQYVPFASDIDGGNPVYTAAAASGGVIATIGIAEQKEG